MRLIIKIFIFLSTTLCFGQLPYSWYPANPSWTPSPASSVNTFSFQTCENIVTSSDCDGLGGWYSYNNNQITTYTSPSYNFPCILNLTVNIQLTLNIENEYDWLYFLYSTDNGANWVNPVATATATVNNNSNINLSAYPPLTTAGIGNNKKGWTGQMGVLNFNYSIPSSATMKFRFIFESDAEAVLWYKANLANPRAVPDATHTVPVDISTNYVDGGVINIYYVDITALNVTCPDILPIELLFFKGIPVEYDNKLIWATSSEINNDYFTVESGSANTMDFKLIGVVFGHGNTNTYTEYSLLDTKPSQGITYYRLTQTDYDGHTTTYDIISLMNTHKVVDDLQIVKITNLLGQEVGNDFTGVKIYYYNNGSIMKTIKLNH